MIESMVYACTFKWHTFVLGEHIRGWGMGMVAYVDRGARYLSNIFFGPLLTQRHGRTSMSLHSMYLKH